MKRRITMIITGIILSGYMMFAQNILTYVGDATSDVKLKGILQLSDSTLLVGGQASNLNWVPGTVSPVTLSIPASKIMSDWSDATHPDSTIHSYGNTTIAFILHVDKDMKTILNLVRLPDNTVVDVTKIKTNTVPGTATGDIYISGELKQIDNNTKNGYYLAKLSDNFLGGVPSTVEWYRNMYVRVNNMQTKYNQPWDVDSKGRIYHQYGETYDFNWGEFHRLDENGEWDYVPNWPYVRDVTLDDPRYPNVINKITWEGMNFSKDILFVKVGKYIVTPGVSNISTCGASDGAINLTAKADSTDTTALYAAVGPLTYEWEGPNNFTSSSQNLSGLSLPGTYKVTITDANNAKAYKEVSLSITTNTLTATIPTPTAISSCGSATGAITVNVSGGTGLYAYYWRFPNGDTAMTQSLSNLDVAGKYTVTVVDMTTGCVKSANSTVNQPTSTFRITGFNKTQINSHWEEFPGAGRLQPKEQNRIGDVVYYWVKPDNTIDSSKSTNTTYLEMQNKPGEYFVMGIDGNNCRYGNSIVLDVSVDVKDTVAIKNFDNAYSIVVTKGSNNGNWYSRTEADWNYVGTDANGNNNRIGKNPFDGMMSNHPCYPWNCPNTSPARIGFSAPYKVGGIFDVVVDKRNDDMYVGQTIMDRYISHVIATDSTGLLRWWDRLTYFDNPTSSDSLNPRTQIDELEIDYTNDMLVVLARTENRANGTYSDCWNGDDLFYNPVASGFQNKLTGGTMANAGKNFSWIGKYDLTNGRIMNATYVADFQDGTATGSAHADANLDGWPDPNTGNPALNEVVAKDMTVDANGNVYIVATGYDLSNGTRTITTAYAHQKMDKESEGKSTPNAFVRVYKSDLSTLLYSSVVVGQWEPVTNGPANGGNNTLLNAVVPVEGGMIVVGNKTTGGNDIPVANIPAWGLASSDVNGIYGYLSFADSKIKITSSPDTVTPASLDTAISYTLPTITYNPGNKFMVLMSSNKLNFVNADTIGEVTATTAGNIDISIPEATANGLYRIKVISTDPQTESDWEAVQVIQTAYLYTAAGLNGSINPPSGVYKVDTTYTITATPDVNYAVSKWIINGSDLVSDTTKVYVTISPVGDSVLVEFALATDDGQVDVVNASSSVYPNPVINQANVVLGSELSGNVIIKVTDIIGTLVMESAVVKTDGVQVESIDMSALPSGIYIVELKSGNISVVNKVTKQ